MIDQNTIDALKALETNTHMFICEEYIKETGQYSSKTVSFDEMRVWIANKAMEVPQTLIMVTNKTTGEIV